MTVTSILDRIQNSLLSHAISQSDHLVIAGFQVIHVIGFVVLLAALVLVSLRLLGVVLTRQPVPQVTGQALRLLWTGLALAVASGSLMFIGSPRHYFYNPAFEIKMGLLLAAVIVQAALFHRIARAERAGPWLTRASVVLSLALWFAVSMAGRAIGFV